MCGRLNVMRDPLCHVVRDKFGIAFRTDTNLDLRPTQTVSTVMRKNNELQQKDLIWGIHPYWAKQLIINAKAETVSVKATFIDGFEHARVIVPCTGWYEWEEEPGGKHKYFFGPAKDCILYIAGIALEHDSKLVILTTESNETCQPYHARMPLLIDSDYVMTWLTGPIEQVFPLLMNTFSGEINIS